MSSTLSLSKLFRILSTFTWTTYRTWALTSSTIRQNLTSTNPFKSNRKLSIRWTLSSTWKLSILFKIIISKLIPKSRCSIPKILSMFPIILPFFQFILIVSKLTFILDIVNTNNIIILDKLSTLTMSLKELSFTTTRRSS